MVEEIQPSHVLDGSSSGSAFVGIQVDSGNPPMRTILQNNIGKPKQFIDGNVLYLTNKRTFTTTVGPGTQVEALQSEEWRKAMD